MLSCTLRVKLITSPPRLPPLGWLQASPNAPPDSPRLACPWPLLPAPGQLLMLTLDLDPPDQLCPALAAPIPRMANVSPAAR
ncbi:hypothetical protein CesoFtcFv8_019277 [Champsocephalus esox]|uniref:Uncharacterized protein n=1 Tax=Champsocephalus esox TaxID=159716 RepID=A0AAN8GQM8_9TELE|nr:hypothetical protein CesoFtcFv8_019277 [Champsocephalus esox]